MFSQTLRRAFLDYFKKKGHRIVPSSPVIPHDDPSLLFINAGMNQFKDVFLGKSKRDYTRAATTQKCIRVGGKHNDLENVGHTTRHCTFFEMLGNFSFGDYFKKEAIAFAWEVSTQVFGFEPHKIWATVFRDDDEAFALWEEHLPKERIIRFGEKDNFWSMGETGPCGPCSELLYDRGAHFGTARSPHEDVLGERYLEFWNLVFMQYDRESSGVLTALPKQSIDTGAGLERVVSLKMGVDTVFQTDVLRTLIAQVEELSGKHYDPKDSRMAPAFHVIADHIRSLSFAIADGVQPSNTDRGYVLRKILRRAVRYGRMLGFERPFLGRVFPRLVSLMGDDFPELNKSSSRIVEILTIEEETFFRTLSRGGNLLQQVMERSKEKISGDDAFKLKDTYGLPLEEIKLIAKDASLTVDLERYTALEEEAKDKSRKAKKATAQAFDANFFAGFAEKHPTTFLGYEALETSARITGLVVDGKFVDLAKEGTETMIFVETTPFYAEMGGQVGDTGEIRKGDSFFSVADTTSPFPGLIAHVGVIEKGEFKKGDLVELKVEGKRRSEIEHNHTATHLLHYALHQILGPHIKQAGSLVEAKRLRFDFHHHLPLTPQELRAVEDLVNDKLRTGLTVKTYEIPFEEAQNRGEIKQFFGEKYGATVRVVDIEFSKELCGGTHAAALGTIGLFKIIKESSIAAGVRRIEAVTGPYAEKKVQSEEDCLYALADALKCPPASLPQKIEALLAEKKELEQKIKQLRKAELGHLAKDLAQKASKVGSLAFVSAQLDQPGDELGVLAEEILHHLRSGVVVLGAIQGERCQLLIAVSADLVSQGKRADLLIKEASPFIQGGGGGKPGLAQAGGKDPSGLPKALAKVKELLGS